MKVEHSRLIISSIAFLFIFIIILSIFNEPTSASLYSLVLAILSVIAGWGISGYYGQKSKYDIAFYVGGRLASILATTLSIRDSLDVCRIKIQSGARVEDAQELKKLYSYVEGNMSALCNNLSTLQLSINQFAIDMNTHLGVELQEDSGIQNPDDDDE